MWFSFVMVLLTIFFGVDLSADILTGSKVKMINGKQVDLGKYTGKPVLVVNIATRCGYTGQLKDLEVLYSQYNKKGLVVLGVPSNDFGGQAPEPNKEIKKFCKLNYGVSFPLTAKMTVKGPSKNLWIKAMINGAKNKQEIAWNFEKFLIDKKGNVIRRFSSKTLPTDKSLVVAIKKLLN